MKLPDLGRQVELHFYVRTSSFIIYTVYLYLLRNLHTGKDKSKEKDRKERTKKKKIEEKSKKVMKYNDF